MPTHDKHEVNPVNSTRRTANENLLSCPEDRRLSHMRIVRANFGTGR